MKKITLENGKTVKISDESYNNLAKATTSSMPWRAEYGGQYWFVKNSVNVVWVYDLRDPMNDFRYASGNYFCTEKEAQKEADRLQALGRVRLAIFEANDGWKPDWKNIKQIKYEILWDYEDNHSWFNRTKTLKRTAELPFIASEEIAEKIMIDHEEDLKRIFRVE